MNEWIAGMNSASDMLVQKAAHNSGGFLFIDPIGDAADELLARFPKRERTLVIDPTDTERPVRWNILEDVSNKPLMAALVRDTVKAVWGYERVATPVMDRMLYNTVAALLEGNYSLLDMEPMLTDASFRERVLKNVSDPYLKNKWEYWSELPQKDYLQLIQSTENKAGEFSEDHRIRTILRGPSSFSLKQLMFDGGAIVLRLPQGELGAKANLFGSLFLAHLKAVAVSRDVAMPFHVYINAAHYFDTPVLRDLLATGKHLNLDVTICHEHLGQLSRELRSSILGNADRRIMFRMGLEDSEFLERSLPENNTRPKHHELRDRQFLAFDGEVRAGYFEKERGSKRRADRIKRESRRFYGRAA